MTELWIIQFAADLRMRLAEQFSRDCFFRLEVSEAALTREHRIRFFTARMEEGQQIKN
jgi:hypothetical protein